MSRINSSEKARIEIIKNATGKSYSASKMLWNNIKNQIPVEPTIDFKNTGEYHCKIYYHDNGGKRTYLNLKTVSLLEQTSMEKYFTPNAITNPILSNIMAAQKIAVKFYSSQPNNPLPMSESLTIKSPHDFRRDLGKEIETRLLLLQEYEPSNFKPIIYHYGDDNEFSRVSNMQYIMDNIDSLIYCKIFFQTSGGRWLNTPQRLLEFIEEHMKDSKYNEFFSFIHPRPNESSCNIYNYTVAGELKKDFMESPETLFPNSLSGYPMSIDPHTINLLEAANGSNIQWRLNNRHHDAVRVITEDSRILRNNAILNSVLKHCEHHKIPVTLLTSRESIIKYTVKIDEVIRSKTGLERLGPTVKDGGGVMEVILMDFNHLPVGEDDEDYLKLKNFAHLINAGVMVFSPQVHYSTIDNSDLIIFDDTPENLNNNQSFLREFTKTLPDDSHVYFKLMGGVKYVLGEDFRSIARSYNGEKFFNVESRIIPSSLGVYKLSSKFNLINLGVKNNYTPLVWSPFVLPGDGVGDMFNEAKLTTTPHLQVIDESILKEGMEHNEIYKRIINHFSKYSQEWELNSIKSGNDVLDIYKMLEERYDLLNKYNLITFDNLHEFLGLKPMMVIVDCEGLQESSFDFDDESYTDLFRFGRGAGVFMVEFSENIYGSGFKNANIPMKLHMSDGGECFYGIYGESGGFSMNWGV